MKVNENKQKLETKKGTPAPTVLSAGQAGHL
jgi:hypothetical protein